MKMARTVRWNVFHRGASAALTVSILYACQAKRDAHPAPGAIEALTTAGAATLSTWHPPAPLQTLTAGIQVTSAPLQVLAPSTAAPTPKPQPLVEAPAFTTPGELSDAKLTAPANVQLTHSDNFEAMDVNLRFSVTRDVPRVVGRFVLPTGVELVSGQLELELGAFTRGQTGNMHVIVKVPSTGSYVLAGGIDLHVSSGIKLHKSAAVRVEKHAQ